MRGVCIVLMVMGHVIGFTKDYGMRQAYNNSDLGGLGWLHDFIITFHMPVFLIASGIAFFFFSNRTLSYSKFFRTKFPKLIIPLICWSPTYFIFQSLTKRTAFSVLDVVNTVIQPYQIFWFLHALIFATVFAFLCFKLLKSQLLYLGLSVALFLLAYQFTACYTYWHWNIYYAFGVAIAPYLPKLRPRLKLSIPLALGAVAAMVIVKEAIPLDIFTNATRLINGPIGFFLLYFLAIAIEQIQSSSLIKGVMYLGKTSLIIYLLHGYFTRSAVLLMTKLIGLPHPALYFLVVCTFGIFGPIILFELLQSRSRLFAYSLGSIK
jgi:fucose 4-O-acetylase-like acetyltransferase